MAAYRALKWVAPVHLGVQLYACCLTSVEKHKKRMWT